MNIRRLIEIKTQFEALHQYTKAPEGVGFLRSLHRHLFLVTVNVEVEHNDREVEFFLLKRQVDKFIKKWLNQAEKQDDLPIVESCEDSAERIARHIFGQYKDQRSVIVEVSEDGENSAQVVINQ